MHDSKAFEQIAIINSTWPLFKNRVCLRFINFKKRLSIMNMPNLKELMSKAKEMQKHMQDAQQEITALKVFGEAGAGMTKVRVKMNGAHKIENIQFSPALLENAADDEEMLVDLLMAAINSAVDKIENATKEKMMSLAKGMNLPTDFGDLGGEDDE